MEQSERGSGRNEGHLWSEYNPPHCKTQILRLSNWRSSWHCHHPGWLLRRRLVLPIYERTAAESHCVRDEAASLCAKIFNNFYLQICQRLWTLSRQLSFEIHYTVSARLNALPGSAQFGVKGMTFPLHLVFSKAHNDYRPAGRSPQCGPWPQFVYHLFHKWERIVVFKAGPGESTAVFAL